MPDGDIIQLGIPGQYVKAYRQICEGVAPESCARNLARGLKLRIHFYGPGPRELLQRMSPLLESLQQHPMPLLPQHLTQLYRTLEQERRMVSGHREGLDIAGDVCKRFLHRIQRGAHISDLYYELAYLFVEQVLARSYDARVAAIQEHFDGVPPEIIYERREEIAPFLGTYLTAFARQITCLASDKHLRLARMSHKPLDPYGDLEDIL